MRNARLKELQAGIKKGGRNINNLRYADDTTLMAESKEELEIKLPTFAGLQKNQGNFRKNSISVSSTMPKPLTVWLIIKCGTLLKRWEYQITLSVS